MSLKPYKFFGKFLPNGNLCMAFHNSVNYCMHACLPAISAFLVLRWMKQWLVTVPILCWKPLKVLNQRKSSHMLLFGANAKYAPLLPWKWLSRSKIFCPIDTKATVFWFMMKRLAVWCIIDASSMWYGRFAVATGCLAMSAGSSGPTDVISTDLWTFWAASFTPNIIPGFPAEKES